MKYIKAIFLEGESPPLKPTLLFKKNQAIDLRDRNFVLKYADWLFRKSPLMAAFNFSSDFGMLLDRNSCEES